MSTDGNSRSCASFTPSGAGGPWGGIYDGTLPSKQCGEDLSAGPHPGVLAGIGGAESVAEIIEGERLANSARLCRATPFLPSTPRHLLVTVSLSAEQSWNS